MQSGTAIADTQPRKIGKRRGRHSSGGEVAAAFRHGRKYPAARLHHGHASCASQASDVFRGIY